MASSLLSSSSSSSSSPVLISWRTIYICFLAFILFGSCFASRPLMEKKSSVSEKVEVITPLELLKIYQEKQKLQRAVVFNVLPKGTPIPPSGPSKRHNSEGN